MGGDSALSGKLCGEIEWARGIAPPGLAKMDDPDERGLVERGYDALSHHYRANDPGDGQYAPWLAALRRRLPAAAAVLDLGCGCGVPAARFLAAAGHRVTGVDISAVQVGRARRLVPTGTFLPEQPRLIGRIATWLRPGGWLLATAGDSAWTGTGEKLARRSRPDVVEPGRPVDLPILAAGGRAAGRRRGVRARGDERARPLLGPPTPA
ncbi:class I SAM-dependent methyltransferase [Micromonospora carbonacea]|uniref:class I SAM-dependent methyltransferase n=1 Tax=Micromonospora carbonacea TaxID=47853 RepID=UPI003D73879E